MGSIMSSAMRNVSIAPWEYMALLVYIVFIGIIFSSRKRKHVKKDPEYKYYVLGLYAKIIGGFIFTMVYMFHYRSGDVFSFFASSKVLSDLAFTDIGRFLDAMLSENSKDNYYRIFDPYTGYPVNYIYWDDRTYMLVRAITPITILSFNSFILTTAIVSTIAYDGVWKLYRTLVRYYPGLQGQLAFSVLFLPSSVFWGSAILKDTFTFSGLCYYIYAVDQVFFRKRGGLHGWSMLLLGTVMMVLMKPYVFMVLFPSSLLWILYQRVQRLRNALLRVLVLPLAGLLLAGISLNVLERMEGRLDKFSLNRALHTIVTAQRDLKRSEQYGQNYFDLGTVEATWQSVLSKFPEATFAGLFRPALPDVTNMAMLISALENSYLLMLTLVILLRSRIVFLLTLLIKNPLLQMCYSFAIAYAFIIAVNTPNFGAMVRFKIPLLPLFVSALFITRYILDQRRQAIKQGMVFRFGDYADGTPMTGR